MIFTYLLINFFTILIPFVVSFTKRYYFYATWSAAWQAIFITAAIFIVWDVWFTSMGIWGFNPDYLLGLDVFLLPIEEWLFFICIPYACLFTYFCVKQLNLKNRPKIIKIFTWLIVIVLMIVGLISYQNWYTSITFLFTSIFLAFYLVKYGTAHLPHFYLSYLIIYAFPFLIVNGILTGSFIAEPVVWYNNTENLSLRVITIPIEDFVYGFLLYLMNVFFYELRLKKD